LFSRIGAGGRKNQPQVRNQMRFEEYLTGTEQIEENWFHFHSEIHREFKHQWGVCE